MGIMIVSSLEGSRMETIKAMAHSTYSQPDLEKVSREC